MWYICFWKLVSLMVWYGVLLLRCRVILCCYLWKKRMLLRQERVNISMYINNKSKEREVFNSDQNRALLKFKKCFVAHLLYFRVFFTWLSNKFSSGMAYNTFKSSNYEKLCVRDYSKMLSALDWHRNRQHCHVFWMPAPAFESLHTFSATFQLLKPTTTNLLLM